MADENSNSNIGDSSSAECQKEDVLEVDSSSLETKNHPFSLTVIQKPVFFVENSDALYYCKHELNLNFPCNSKFCRQKGNIKDDDSTIANKTSTSAASALPADFYVQARLAREQEGSSGTTTKHNAVQQRKYNENKDSGETNDVIVNTSYTTAATSPVAVLPDVLCKNPILPGCYRPSRCCSPMKISKTHQEKPRRCTLHLTLQVSEVRFYDHPAFIQEERLCAQLQLTYDKYRHHVAGNILSLLKPKLAELIRKFVSLLLPTYDNRNTKNELNGENDDSVENAHFQALKLNPSFATIAHELTEVVSLTLDEMYNFKELGSTIWDLWKNLQDCRTRQNFKSTRVEVVVTTSNSKQYEDSDFHEYSQQLAGCLRQVLKCENLEDLIKVTSTEQNYQLLRTEYLQNLLIATETLTSISATEIEFTVLPETKGNNNVAMATKNIQELERRRQVTSEKYYLRVAVDDKFVGDTKPVSLMWPRFSLPFDHTFKFNLTQQPKNIAVQLVQCAPGAILMMFNKVVTSTFVGTSEELVSTGRVPCSTTEFITPTLYQFASHQAFRTKGRTARLKGIMGVLVNLDGNQPWQLRPSSYSMESSVCSPNLTAKSRFHGLIMPQRRCIMTQAKILGLNKGDTLNIDMQQELNKFVLQEQNDTDKNMTKNSVPKINLSEIVRTGHQFHNNFDLSSIITSWLQPRKRSLRPSNIPRPSWFGKPSSTAAYNLVVTIVSARNVPSRQIIRSEEIIRSPTRKSPARRLTRMASLVGKRPVDDLDVTPMTFARVRFQGGSLVTRAIAGHSPIWKKTFSFRVHVSNDEFTPRALSFVQDVLYVDLFDATEVDFGIFGGYYADEHTLLTENRFLGGFSVPFSRLLLAERSESVVRLDSPSTFIGYDKVCNVVQKSQGITSAPRSEFSQLAVSKSLENATGPVGGVARGGASTSELLIEAESSTYIKVSIAIDPPLHFHDKEPSFCTRNEEILVINHAQRWVQQLRSNYQTVSKRILPVFVQDTQNFDWLITRYLKSQNPPAEIDSVHKCAYFVSLVPVLERKSTTKKWLTNHQFLDAGSGAWGQHAILLASYFMNLGSTHPETCSADVNLVFGKANLESEAVYVMRLSKVDGETVLWDASKGIAHAKGDERCPMNDIGAVVTPENIYANVQNSGKPCLMSFDLKDKKFWRPFYSSRFPQPSSTVASVQKSDLIYRLPDTNSAYELQAELMESLKTNIRQWRRITTCFNGDVGNRLNAILEHLENDKLHAITSAAQKYKVMLESATKGRRVFGVDLHLSFTSVDDIISSVESTGVHMCRHPDVEFALGVKVFPYCSEVRSVRVFIVSIYP